MVAQAFAPVIFLLSVLLVTAEISFIKCDTSPRPLSHLGIPYPRFLSFLSSSAGCRAELALHESDKTQSTGEVLEVEDFNKAKPLSPVAASLSS